MIDVLSYGAADADEPGSTGVWDVDPGCGDAVGTVQADGEDGEERRRREGPIQGYVASTPM